MSTREVRFWPLLFGVYAVVWGVEAVIRGLQGLPLTFTLEITLTDLAIFGIVVGVWLLASAILTPQTTRTATETVRI